MPLPTPEEVRELFIKKNLKPVTGRFNLTKHTDTFELLCTNDRRCCAVTAILLGEKNPCPTHNRTNDGEVWARALGVNYEEFEKFWRGFDNYNEYWKAVEDLVTHPSHGVKECPHLDQCSVGKSDVDKA